MSEPAELVPPTRAAPSGTERGTVRYSVPETARLLGISERAVRKRITAGTLDAHKEGSAWVVLLPATMEAVPAAPAAPGAVPAATPGGGTAAVDLAPMAELIDRLTRDNQELAAAAALWQERARFLGERLQALEAGPIAGDVGEDAAQDAQREPTAHERREAFWHAPARSSDSLIGRLRRLLGR